MNVFGCSLFDLDDIGSFGSFVWLEDMDERIVDISYSETEFTELFQKVSAIEAEINNLTIQKEFNRNYQIFYDVILHMRNYVWFIKNILHRWLENVVKSIYEVGMPIHSKMNSDSDSFREEDTEKRYCWNIISWKKCLTLAITASFLQIRLRV